jgi:hypothetical protein
MRELKSLLLFFFLGVDEGVKSSFAFLGVDAGDKKLFCFP